MMLYNPEDTIVALATPQGLGAIGVIRLSGLQAISITNRVFRGKDLEQVESHTIHFGTIRQLDDRVVDEVLVSVFRTPRSYTRENVIEVSCHGSPYIIQELLQLFVEQGARMAQPGEFTMRAFLNGQLDLSQAEAVADLIASNSAAQHELAMKQMRGGYSKQIKDLRQELLHFASMIELELDFGEEDVEFADRKDLRVLVEKLCALIRNLTSSFQLGNVIKNGVNTVIAGRPNAGKSTLLNVLLNEERAIVSEIAGTTRDVIEETLNIEGVAFRLIDTAGIREATDQIEAIGVGKTFEKIRQSALLVYVYDCTQLNADHVWADLQQIGADALTTIIVANKSDLYSSLTDSQRNELQGRQDPNINWSVLEERYTFVHISAKAGEQVDLLQQALVAQVLEGKTSADSTVVSNARHYNALLKADESLTAVLDGLAAGITGDFLAMDIRHAQRYLSEIIGDVITSDDILGEIFGNFCIGK